MRSHPAPLLVLGTLSVTLFGGATLALGQPSGPSPTPGSGKPVPVKPGLKGKPGAMAGASAFMAALRTAAQTSLSTLRSAAKPADVAKNLDDLFDLAVAYAQLPADNEALADIAADRRLVHQLAAAADSDLARVEPLLLANPQLARTLALAALPSDKPESALSVLAQLDAKYHDALADDAGNANLAAAVCWVYDVPPAHPTREGQKAVQRADAGTVFNHFLADRAKLVFQPHDLPVQLVMHVVDVHVSQEELEWAANTYPNNRNAGKLFGSITYDTAFFKRGQDKKVLSESGGYTLMNIKKVGGVCAEQAYFATEVCKSLGIPSAYIFARDSKVAHAYVGYIRQAGDGLTWDMTEGRYQSYQRLAGYAMDPQTGREVTDAELALTAGLSKVRPAERDQAVALTDAAARIGELRATSAGFSAKVPESVGAVPQGAARTPTVEAQLEFAEASIRVCASHLPGWHAVQRMATKDKLPEDVKKKWAEAVVRMCGRQYPDFAFDFLLPMIRTVEPVDAQDQMWEWAAGQYTQRPDLVSGARLEQGNMWAKAGQKDRALAAYGEIVTRYANEGTSVVTALEACERLVAGSGKPGAALAMYEDAFRRTTKPSQMSAEATAESNYFRVGFRYAELLEAAGRTADAARVRRQIGLDESGDNTRNKAKH